MLVDFGKQLSHFEWLDNTKLIVTMKYLNNIHINHVIFEDKKGKLKVLAPKKLIWDGHPAISPRGDLLAQWDILEIKAPMLGVRNCVSLDQRVPIGFLKPESSSPPLTMHPLDVLRKVETFN